MDEEVFFSAHNQVELEEKLREEGFEILDSSFEQSDGDIHVNIFARNK